MTEFIPSLSFSKLMSHVFPGFLLVFSFFMLIDLLCNEPGYYTCILFGNNLEKFIVAMVFFLIMGTIFGIIIDGVQHASITRIFENRFNKTESKSIEKYEKLYGIINSIVFDKFFKEYDVKNSDKKNFNILLEKSIMLDKKFNWFFFIPFLGIDKYKFYTEEFYYYYEFFANISLILPFLYTSTFFYTYTILSYPFLLSFSITLFLIIVWIFCLYFAWFMYKDQYKFCTNIVLGTLVDKVLTKR